MRTSPGPMPPLPPETLQVAFGAMIVLVDLYDLLIERGQLTKEEALQRIEEHINVLAGRPSLAIAEWMLRHVQARLSGDVSAWATLARTPPAGSA